MRRLRRTAPGRCFDFYTSTGRGCSARQYGNADRLPYCGLFVEFSLYRDWTAEPCRSLRPASLQYAVCMPTGNPTGGRRSPALVCGPWSFRTQRLSDPASPPPPAPSRVVELLRKAAAHRAYVEDCLWLGSMQQQTGQQVRIRTPGGMRFEYALHTRSACAQHTLMRKVGVHALGGIRSADAQVICTLHEHHTCASAIPSCFQGAAHRVTPNPESNP